MVTVSDTSVNNMDVGPVVGDIHLFGWTVLI